MFHEHDKHDKYSDQYVSLYHVSLLENTMFHNLQLLNLRSLLKLIHDLL